jgi:hypothetical protein
MTWRYEITGYIQANAQKSLDPTNQPLTHRFFPIHGWDTTDNTIVAVAQQKVVVQAA